MPQTHSDVACTVCGCACDDLQVTVDGNRITQVQRACNLAEPWFASLSKPATRPPAAIDGKPVLLMQAIERAAGILRESKTPLVWGLTRSSTAGHRAAIALAEKFGGTIDTTSSCNPAATLAMQKVGQSTCSLGEVRNRADLVIFWGADPMTSHPRHLERYSVEPRGQHIPGGRADRMVIVIDTEPTATSRLADKFIQIPIDSQLEAISAVRESISESEETPFVGVGDLNEGLQQLAVQMKGCQYGALFFGVGQGEQSLATAEALLQLTTELNKFTRFTAHYMPASGGLTGAENVLCWQTGFPFAINFATGYPRFNADEFSANRLLDHNEVDACVLVGSEGVAKLSPSAQSHWKKYL